jgi:hypothetical protein
MQPIGRKKDKLMTQLGIIAKNGNAAPLTYPSWDDMPIRFKDDIWHEVQV